MDGDQQTTQDRQADDNPVEARSAEARERDEGGGKQGDQGGDKGRQQDQKNDAKQGEHGKDDDAAKGDQKKPMPRWKKLLYWAIGLAILAVLITGAVLYWLYARQFVSTDDAFVDGYISRVSAQVSARVNELRVVDNQEVKAGQVLMELDPRDYQARVDQARASLVQAQAAFAQAQAQVGQQQASVDQAQAQVRVQEANLSQQQQDLTRYQALDPRAIARQTVQNTSQGVKAGQAQVDAAKQAVASARAQVKAAEAQVEASRAQVGQAQAQLDTALLNLSYCEIRASVDGRVTQRTVDVGNYVSPGQALLAVVPSEVWVTANFKETQLGRMQVGQRVKISVDAFPGVDFEGRVNSFQRGSGTVFSTLPAENATGNYVKVVQRLPVKITFDGQPWKDYQLAPGLSVEPRVTVR
jgi:membrane fusion protein (multidrug efflux system)